jgi:hypothetical protein
MKTKAKGVILAMVVAFALTGLTYFYTTPVPLLAENDPFFWYYSVISVSETSSSVLATLHGFPFSYVLESDAVFIFGAFSFILDFIFYLVIASLLLWLIFKSGNTKLLSVFEGSPKKYPRKK